MGTGGELGQEVELGAGGGIWEGQCGVGKKVERATVKLRGEKRGGKIVAKRGEVGAAGGPNSGAVDRDLQKWRNLR